ncbi:e3 ubiquitin-protein ligase TTC3 [Trichonephila clavata]|uniref:E3 ubiquitin-protein ligase TTC3 n=1 Tax=Trichonephila clavata TaxID=2740835 RepID=A0A8X6IGN0_TRICU|nr:e3 ubiquitin-protein ligase TTC3 [Trichonephila clavata]
MFQGLDTTSLYDRCIAAGLCKAHRKELKAYDDSKSQEIQRKALLYIRLQIFGPILHQRPFCCEKLRVLFAKAECFSAKENQENHDQFIDRLLVLDSIAVFLLCHFCKICCVGAFFESGPRALIRPESEEDIFLKLLTHTTIDETDIGLLTPLLDNFKDVSDVILKVSYVAVLLYVRNISVKIDINEAVRHIDVNMKNDAEESQRWETIGNDAFGRENWEEAFEAYSVALNFKPYCSSLLVHRSYCLTKMWRVKDAVMDGYLTVMIDPFNISGYIQMIIPLFMLEDFMFCIDVADYCLYKCSGNTEISKLETVERIKGKAETSLIAIVPGLANEHISKLEKRALARRNVNDLPELIEPSDSDSDCQDAPNPTEASNSGESDSNIDCSKPKINGCPNGSLKIVEDEVKILQESLKEASQTLLNGHEVMAMRRFRDALDEIKGSPEIHKYEECDIICIKYAYAFACYKSGGYDNIQKAITILKEITEKNTDIVFPAAYYCIGLAYLKIYRFKLALENFRIVDDMLQKKVQCNSFVWPGIVTVIEETKLDHLKSILPDLIKECENPPLPNATCRYEDCSLQPSIYYSDPDFKGLYCIHCSEHCYLQYHVQCWKSIRTLANHIDKEFLDKKCYTPDCEGVIVHMQVINKEGDVVKEFSVGENKKVSKQKKTKLEKKLEIKVEKKRKRKDSSSRTESISEIPEDISYADPPVAEINNPPKEVKNQPKHDVKDLHGHPSLPNIPTLNVNAEPFIVLKKEKPVNEISYKVPTKTKEHKKMKSNTYSIDEFLQKAGVSLKSKEHHQRSHSLRHTSHSSKETAWEISYKVPTKTKEHKKMKSNTYSIDEFLQKAGVSLKSKEHHQRSHSLRHTSHSSKETAWVKNINNIYMPSASTTDDIQSKLSTLSFNGSPETSKTEENASLDLKSELEFPKPSFNFLECIKKNMYSHFKEILGKYGPLRVDDPRLMNKVKNFPEELQILTDSDGIGKFLQQDVEFAFVRETYVCLVDQLPAAYKKLDEVSLPIQNIDRNVTSNFETSDSVEGKNSEIFRFSCLNPDAREYLPEISSEFIPENRTNVKSYKEVLEHNSRDMRSTISKLRQPLTVDEAHSKSSNSSLQQVVSEKVCQSSTASSGSSFQNEAGEDPKIKQLVEKFRVALNMYSDEDVKENQSFIDEFLKHFSLIQIPKKSNASIQTENVEVEKISRGTMQSDDELQRLKEMTKKLLDQKGVLVEQCKSALDSATEYRKNSSDEITNLRKELSDAKIKLQEQAKEFKTQKKDLEKLHFSNESLKLDCTVMEDQMRVLQQEKLKLRQEVDGNNRLKDDMKRLELEKVEVEKRAQNAECLLLELKKTELKNRVQIKKTEALNKIEEVQNGISLISVHLNPMVVKNMEHLVTQIRKYIITLEDILKEFTVQIAEQVKEVNKGVPLKNFKPFSVIELPEIPNLSSDQMSKLMHQVSWPHLLTNPASNVTNFNPYQFPMASTTIPSTKPNLSNPLQQNPLLSSSYSSFENAANQAGKQPVSSNTKVPPGLTVTKTALHAPSMSVHNISSIENQKINMTQQKNSTQVLGSTSSWNLNPVKKTSDIRFGSSNIELDYNIKKKDTPFTASTRASSSRSNTASPNSKKNSDKDVKKSFEKLLSKLQEKFPHITSSDIVTTVREFRDNRVNGLSGLTLENIVQLVSEILEAKEKSQAQEQNSRTKMMPNAVLVNKKLVSDERLRAPPPPESSLKKSAWGNRETDHLKQWSGSTVDECSICYEEMTSSTAYKVDCNHSFHLKCIKKWLEKKSDCPICRVHLLLPEDYPALS